MRRHILLTLLCAIIVGGLILAYAPNSITAQGTNQGITRVQSLDGGAVNHRQQWCDNTTQQETIIPANNQTSTTLNKTPKEGNVLIAAIGLQVLISNSPSYFVNVSSITQEGVTWTRQVGNFYRGWMDSVEIWLGVVGTNAGSTITFNIAVDPPRADFIVISYAVCEYSGVATVSPLDQTAIAHDTGATTNTGKTALTSNAKELWIGAVFVESSVNQTVGLNDFSLVGGTTKGTEGRITTALVERIVDEKGTAWSGTQISGENMLVGYLGCIATFYAGDQIPDNPNSTPTPTLSPSNGSSPELEFTCQSTTSTGIKVNIQGKLTANGAGITNEPILFSYSVNNGASWNDLTTVNTDNTGSFAVMWNPTVTGNYLIQAVWAGNSAYPATNTTINFVITPIESENAFSINSNSTLSTLNFDSTTKQLSFTVNGSTGSTGYVDVYIPKSLMNDISGLTVNLDDTQIEYTSRSQGEYWLVSFTYHHSTHQVTLNLNQPAQGIGSWMGWILVAAILIPLAIVIALLAVGRNKKQTQTK